MDRNGVIHDVAAEFGYTGTGQAKDITIQGAQGLNNRNIVGMEIIALNDRDVTASQIAALKQFAEARYPNTPFYGHGEISTGKEADEGVAGARAILEARSPLFNFDWSNAPIPNPAAPAASPASAAALPLDDRMGFGGGFFGPTGMPEERYRAIMRDYDAYHGSTFWNPEAERPSANIEDRREQPLPGAGRTLLAQRSGMHTYSGGPADPIPEPNELSRALGVDTISQQEQI